MLTKRDAENARLRDQREQQAAELNERKHKDNVKCSSVHEWKALADSRSVRVLSCVLNLWTSQKCRNGSLYGSPKFVDSKLSWQPTRTRKISCFFSCVVILRRSNTSTPSLIDYGLSSCVIAFFFPNSSRKKCTALLRIEMLH